MSKESKLINTEHLKLFKNVNDVVVNDKINNKLNNVVGDLNSLTTEDKDNIVDAINEIDYELATDADVNNLFGKIGGVKFTAKQANSTVGLNRKSSYQTLEYSTDDGDTWNSMTTSTNITLANSGDSVYVRGVLGGNNSTSYYTQFKMTGNIKASGNINYLWNKDNPDAELKNYCGYNLFYNCTALSDVSKLKLHATTLANYCYYYMFRGCTSLTTEPELPATTLAEGCYYYMFNGCSSLTTAPKLPATTLAFACYRNMFQGCTSLTTAPKLPATTLAIYCYREMFKGCTSLTTAPELPATTLVQSCYDSMFNGCTNLNYIKCLATDISATECTYGWVNGVAATGTFVKAPIMTGWTTGTNGIPTGWTVEGNMPAVKFTAKQANSTIGLSRISGYQTFEYTTNGETWNELTTWDDVTLANSGDSIYVRGGLSMDNSTSEYTQFRMSGDIKVSGNINYLWDRDNPDAALKQYCGYSLFYNCTALTDASELIIGYPTTTLADSCYKQMFRGCTSLTTAPELPATTLASNCYYYMFYGCTNLNYIKCLATNISANMCTTSWVYNIASTGTFVKDASMTGWSRNTSGIPADWTVQDA